VGLNRFVWSGTQQSTGLVAPPGAYQARLRIGAASYTTTFNMLIDPRLAAEGVTNQDLVALFEHNTRMLELTNAVSRLNARLTEAENRLANAQGAAADTLARVRAVAAKVRTEPVRYGKPGLSAHVSYLRGMTSNVDQHPGSDALARYQVLKKEVDDAVAELNRAIGGG
jgi:hypothetical protein